MKITLLAIAIALITITSLNAEIPPYCTTIVHEDFEDGDRAGWSDQCICYCDGYSLDVIYSAVDDSYVLRHEGGDASGGGNCEVYSTGLVVGDCAIEARIRNVRAYHTYAKAMGLALRVNEATGVQYLCWLTVAGDLFLYKTTNWTTCGPTYLAHKSVDPMSEGDEFTLRFSAVGNTLCVQIGYNWCLTYEDPDPLPAGTAGVLATAGITDFDDIYITNCDLPSATEATTFGRIKAMFR